MAALAGQSALDYSLNRGFAEQPGGRVHPPLPGLPHFAPKAKSIIYLHMNGGPSQIDMWDYKPAMQEQFDKDLPDSIRNGQRITTMTSGQARFPVAPSKFKFTQHGQCQRWVSELLPHTAKIVDELAIVKSVHTNAINHDPACTFVMTGNEVPGKASLGSWLAYGLGSESDNLPAFVVLTPTWTSSAAAQALFTRMWSSGFLPTRYAGVALRTGGDPVLYLPNPDGVTSSDRRAMLDALGQLNQQRLAELHDPEIETRISQYEMAFRMQVVVPELMDLSQETAELLADYGAQPGAASFANNCLLARRLVEKGVRFVQLSDWGWDFHGTNAGEDLRDNLVKRCQLMDRPVAALIRDLKQRGLLDETLVVWMGEFGRTPFREGRTAGGLHLGRDHHPYSNTMFMAGGGLKPGITFGATDELGFHVAEHPVHIHDVQATILHLLGLDHTRLTYRFQGRDYRLTDVSGQVVQGILS